MGRVEILMGLERFPTDFETKQLNHDYVSGYRIWDKQFDVFMLAEFIEKKQVEAKIQFAREWKEFFSGVAGHMSIDFESWADNTIETYEKALDNYFDGPYNPLKSEVE